MRRVSEAITFVAGAAILGTQMAVGSVVASTLGASTLAWAATIAVVLLSLSIGYWLGGCAADRRPDARSFALLVVAGGAALLISPPAIQALLHVARASGASLSPAFALPLLIALALLAMPMILLGAVLPYAVRLQLARSTHGGSVVGRFYAISTAGSLAGLFVVVLALAPLVGALRTCVALGLAVAGAGLAALALDRGRTIDDSARTGVRPASPRAAGGLPARTVSHCLCVAARALPPFKRAPRVAVGRRTGSATVARETAWRRTPDAAAPADLPEALPTGTAEGGA